MGFAIFWVASTQSTIMGDNRLMHLILLIEFAMPSAAVRLSSTRLELRSFARNKCTRVHCSRDLSKWYSC